MASHVVLWYVLLEIAETAVGIAFLFQAASIVRRLAPSRGPILWLWRPVSEEEAARRAVDGLRVLGLLLTLHGAFQLAIAFTR